MCCDGQVCWRVKCYERVRWVGKSGVLGESGVLERPMCWESQMCWKSQVCSEGEVYWKGQVLSGSGVLLVIVMSVARFRCVAKLIKLCC